MDAPIPAGNFLDAVFPERCPLCGSGVALPGPCAEHRWHSGASIARCGRCARRLGAGLPDGFRCAECARCPPGFQRARVLGDYSQGGALREWTLALKHGNRPDLARPLGLALARLLDPIEVTPPAQRPWIIPVPLHPLRRWERGYDQAWLLACAIAESSGHDLVRALRRKRWTAPQGSPGSGARTSNVSGVFALRPRRRVEGRDIWLVDDVLTSGATASECARVLRRAGAARVGVLAVARAAGVADSLI